jgi:hypothetical protein
VLAGLGLVPPLLMSPSPEDHAPDPGRPRPGAPGLIDPNDTR